MAPPQRASTAKVEGKVLAGTATAVSESWGNITTSFVAADVERLKLKLGDDFQVTSDGGAITVTLARHYSEVKQGQGVAFVTPDGFVRVQINGGRASEKLKVVTGGVVLMGRAR